MRIKKNRKTFLKNYHVVRWKIETDLETIQIH